MASAQRAKSQLDGADIYAGCCTLKIEYAKVIEGHGCNVVLTFCPHLQTTKLNVYKNDDMTWDFTSQGDAPSTFQREEGLVLVTYLPYIFPLQCLPYI